MTTLPHPGNASNFQHVHSESQKYRIAASVHSSKRLVKFRHCAVILRGSITVNWTWERDPKKKMPRSRRYMLLYNRSEHPQHRPASRLVSPLTTVPTQAVTYAMRMSRRWKRGRSQERWGIGVVSRVPSGRSPLARAPPRLPPCGSGFGHRAAGCCCPATRSRGGDASTPECRRDPSVPSWCELASASRRPTTGRRCDSYLRPGSYHHPCPSTRRCASYVRCENRTRTKECLVSHVYLLADQTDVAHMPDIPHGKPQSTNLTP